MSRSRPPTTRHARLLFVAANERRKCDTRGCPKNRSWTRRFCQGCDWAPDARAIDRKLVDVYARKMATFIKDYATAPSVVAALDIMSRILSGRMSTNKYLLRELRRLREAPAGPVSCEEALAAVGGVYLLHLYRPETLDDGKRLTFAIANRFFRARPLESRRQQSRKTGLMYHYVYEPRCEARGVLGGLVRKHLAVFLHNVFSRIEDDYRIAVRQRMALKEPIAGREPMPPLPTEPR